jgi:hypothetical protein
MFMNHADGHSFRLVDLLDSIEKQQDLFGNPAGL